MAERDAGAPVLRLALVLYGTLAALNLGALTAGENGVASAAQWFLMPALALVFLAAPPPGVGPVARLRSLTLAALFFSWVGDTLPDVVAEDVRFPALVAAFLCAQWCFIAGFWPWRHRSVARRRAVLAIYLAALVALIVLCAPEAGGLLGPVIVYGASLTTMALLATGLGRLAGWGGALFLVSDALIALGAFRDLDGRVFSVAVMATYIAAELLLVLGIQRHRHEHAAPMDRR